MEEKKVYLIQSTNKENGMRYNSIVGVFGSFEKAANALDELFHKEYDAHGVQEFNVFSHYTDGESFKIEEREADFGVFYEIKEVILNQIINN